MRQLLEQTIEKSDWEAFIKYLSGLSDTVPLYIYEMLGSVFLVCAVALLAIKGWKGSVWSIWILLAEYVFLIICFTVIFREYAEAKPIELRLFWSYKRALSGDTYLFYENLMNIAVFVPIGFLMGLVVNWKKCCMVLLFGLLFSCSIEVLQLIFHRGLCELDDVVHNTIGCIIGVLFFQLAKATYIILQKDKLIS